MDINWYGHACFRLKDRNLTVVCDPYDKSIGLTLPRLRADVVTISHQAPGHNYAKGVKEWRKVIDGPGEYELEGVFITGIPTFHGLAEGDEGPPAPNTVFLFEFDDLTVCHLGDVGRILTQAHVEAMPDIHVLMVPVGGRYTLDAAQAAEVISIIEPQVVIPMHYRMPNTPMRLEPVERFLKEMGVPAPEPVSLLRLTRSRLPDETQVVVMESR